MPSISSPAATVNSFDHLPDVVDPDPECPPVAVPILPCSLYTGGDFNAYPAQRGWHPQQFLTFHAFLVLQDDTKREEQESFLQSWLFFGLLVEFFRLFKIEVDQSEFVRADVNGSTWLTTRPLTLHITELMNRGHGVDRDVVEKCTSYFNIVQKFCKTFLWMHGSLEEHKVVRPSIGLSFEILAVTLHNVLYQKYFSIPSTRFSLERSGWSGLAFGTTLFRHSRLSSLDLCPSLVDRLLAVCKIDTQYFISCMRRPKDTRDHSSCTSSSCVSMNIDPSRYKTYHVRETCLENPCSSIVVDGEHLCTVLGHGSSYPILVLGEQKQVQPLVVAADSGVPYIAISHVWADGMGNDAENSVPWCTFEMLSRLVRDAADLTFTADDIRRGVWIDTLCVPVLETQRESRRLAILRMGEIYRNAAAVLVIDRGLMQVNRPGSLSELRFRIIYSTWYQRLWTLQEGGFAKKLCIVFADGIVVYDDIEEAETRIAVAQRGLDLALSCLTNDAARQFQVGIIKFFPQGIFQFRDETEGVLNFFSLLLGALTGRSTTHARDEAICLAVLLGVEFDDISKARDEDRMALLYGKLDKVPPNLIFAYGPKLQRKGLRWAPSSFLGKWSAAKSDAVTAGMHSTPLDHRGVVVPYPVFFLLPLEEPTPVSRNIGRRISTLFSRNKPPLRSSNFAATERIFFYDETSTRWFMITKSTEDSSSTRKRIEALNPLPLPQISHSAVIVTSYVPSHPKNSSWVHTGALVSIDGPEKERYVQNSNEVPRIRTNSRH